MRFLAVQAISPRVVIALSSPGRLNLTGKLLRPSDVTLDPEPFVPSLVAQDSMEVFGLLREGVSQYRSGKIQMQTVTLSTRDLLLMSPYARSYKYRQIDRLFDAYRAVSYTHLTLPTTPYV